MPNGSLGRLLQTLRGVLGARPEGDVTDGQLLQRFAAQHDEEAFRTLVDRHGPMVLGVCRRMLRQPADAEDTFQATFLILARKAGSITRPDRLGNWLYGVAYRTGRQARARRGRRWSRQTPLRDVPAPAGEAAEGGDEVREALDEELQRLPDRYRAPLVLCYLEGKTREEASRQLGCTPGTIKGRLERGRELLRSRLVRRGLALSAGALATLFEDHVTWAHASAALADTTLRAAVRFVAGADTGAGVLSERVVSLSEGVLKAMSLSRLRSTVIVLLAAGVLLPAGGLTYQKLAVRADEPPAAGTPAVPEGPKPPPARDVPLARTVRAVVLAPRETLRLQMTTKKLLRTVINPRDDVLSVEASPTDPATVVITGRNTGVSRVTLTDADGKEEGLVIVVVPREKPVPAAAEPRKPSLFIVPALVARRDLPVGTLIRKPEDLFKRVYYVHTAAPKDVLVDFEQLEGKQVKRPLAEDQPVKEKDLEAALGTATRGRVPFVFQLNGALPDGVFPGTRVYVMLRETTGDKGEALVTFAKDVLVVDVDGAAEGKPLPITVKLSMTPEEARKLTRAEMAEKGRIRLEPARKGS